MKNMTDGMTAAAIENNRDIEIYLEFFIQTMVWFSLHMTIIIRFMKLRDKENIYVPV